MSRTKAVARARVEKMSGKAGKGGKSDTKGPRRRIGYKVNFEQKRQRFTSGINGPLKL